MEISQTNKQKKKNKSSVALGKQRSRYKPKRSKKVNCPWHGPPKVEALVTDVEATGYG